MFGAPRPNRARWNVRPSSLQSSDQRKRSCLVLTGADTAQIGPFYNKETRCAVGLTVRSAVCGVGDIGCNGKEMVVGRTGCRRRQTRSQPSGRVARSSDQVRIANALQLDLTISVTALRGPASNHPHILQVCITTFLIPRTVIVLRAMTPPSPPPLYHAIVSSDRYMGAQALQVCVHVRNRHISAPPASPESSVF